MSLASNVSAIYGAFSDIKDAIEDKGVTVAANTPVTSYANLIGDISGGLDPRFLKKYKVINVFEGSET